MQNKIKEIMEDFREKFVFEGEYPGDGSKMLYLRNDVEALESFLSLALTRVEEAGYNRGFQACVSLDNLAKTSEKISAALSPSEEKESVSGTDVTHKEKELPIVEPKKIDVKKFEKLAKKVKECICNDNDGKGKSACGIDCPIYCSPKKEKRGR